MNDDADAVLESRYSTICDTMYLYMCIIHILSY